MSEFTKFLLFPIMTALVGAGFHLWTRLYESSRTRQIERLSGQLKHLYGPMSFYLNQNCEFRGIQALAEDVMTDGLTSDEHVNQMFSSSARSHIAAYHSQMEDNFDSIVLLLKDNYHYLDAQDIDLVNKIAHNATRWKREAAMDADGNYIDDVFHQGVDGPTLYLDGVAESIEERFLDKLTALNTLSGTRHQSSWWSRLVVWRSRPSEHDVSEKASNGK